ncbi:MAG: hypothetical protein Athens071426_674 [Parcubacteria group bacterium Athens0714_26]|nr:MAG: hypothetical protein Athens101426_382 [Parcubacteria group bacterium Athens1014_26]TSD01398.1 MAG: hypothetical protein Athens071426_674 [Parcubacteria group bacterium Athens0714_26]
MTNKIIDNLNKLSKKEWQLHTWNLLLKDMNDSNFGKALNRILSIYEKNMIVNRLAALALLRKGKSYRKIGEELWLSPTTIRSLKKLLDNSVMEYSSYRTVKNQKNDKNKKNRKIQETPLFINWIDSFINKYPEKIGKRWNY